MNKRGSGILLHISSLPGKYGIGDFGESAYDFIDFLVKSNTGYWQILPLGITGYGDSPYQSFSAFAGNPYFIDLDELIELGYIKEDDVKVNLDNNSNYIDYNLLYKNKMKILKTAYNRSKVTIYDELNEFYIRNIAWLREFSLFMAIKQKHDNKSWFYWKEEYRNSKSKEVIEFEKNNKDEIMFWVFTQYYFKKQWNRLKAYANRNNIKIIGDLPIYVSEDSADIWNNPSLFNLDEELKPITVAGCPPDAFSKTGQLWGNPIYNWTYMKEDNYDWWIKRIKFSFEQFDVLRIDHFRGFESYWEVPYGSKTAENGKWTKGPGIDLFNRIYDELGNLNIIAEDLGFLTKEVHQLIEKTGYPGMKILQFAFDPREDSDYLPHNYDKNSVVYTGTHDNHTIKGWFNNIDEDTFMEAVNYLKLNYDEGLNWGMIRGVWSSVSNIAIAPLQDFLNLDDDSRINIPSTIGDNWKWRYSKTDLNDILASKIKNINKIYRREIVKKNYILEKMEDILLSQFNTKIHKATEKEKYYALSKAIMKEISIKWNETKEQFEDKRQAYYFSAEFLMGRALGNNLINMNLKQEVLEALKEVGIDYNKIEEFEEDAALGNGGLGRLAACFLDSGATLNIPLTGYGIKYEFGLFEQSFKDGFQIESPDDWTKDGDPWTIRKEEEKVIVNYSDQSVFAVPYDMPIIGYKGDTINTLRLWKSEPLNKLDLTEFNKQDYDKSVKEKNDAENISKVLYPDDSKEEGKILRLKQQYFFVSASLKDLINKSKSKGQSIKDFNKYNSIQLNDTHPSVGIPELMRILINEEKLNWNEAWDITVKTFAYTNHTLLAEALEQWPIYLFKKILPEIYEIIVKINQQLIDELESKEIEDVESYKIIVKTNNENDKDEDDKAEVKSEDEDEKVLAEENESLEEKTEDLEEGTIKMAWLSIYGSSYTNGVARLHTDLLKDVELNNWYKIFPERFNNKTNGITQRRWLLKSNPELSNLITELLGSDNWITDLTELKKLEEYKDDINVLERFLKVKDEKKKQLSEYIMEKEGIKIDNNSIFDIQIKRLHEYKRQLLMAFYILDLYYRIKENPEMNIAPRTFIFGAKAAPGYDRAKAIIKFINEIKELINNDDEVNNKIKLVFVENYRVSYAERLFPAADLSEQISTAGKEASGTGNMKFMLNGALTIGTLDGANVEIVEEAGEENNFIFGMRVEDIRDIKEKYDPSKYYNEVKGLKKVVDTLIDGTFDDKIDGKSTGMFKELYDALLKGMSWHQADHYFILKDFDEYRKAQDKVNLEYDNRINWAKKAWINISNAGKFSSDRTIKQYAEEVWKI